MRPLTLRPIVADRIGAGVPSCYQQHFERMRCVLHLCLVACCSEDYTYTTTSRCVYRMIHLSFTEATPQKRVLSCSLYYYILYAPRTHKIQVDCPCVDQLSLVHHASIMFGTARLCPGWALAQLASGWRYCAPPPEEALGKPIQIFRT